MKTKAVLLFIVAIVGQIGMVGLAGAGKAYTCLTGKEIVVDVSQYDPYDLMRGYYLRLQYDFTDIELYEGVKDEAGNRYVRSNDTVYIVLEETDGVWKPIEKVLDEKPVCEQGQIFIKGKMRWSRAKFGIERFYVPEANREDMEKEFTEKSENSQAKLKVDKNGNVVLVGLIIDGKEYDF